MKHCLEAWSLDGTLKAAATELEKLDYHLVDGKWLSPDKYYPAKGYLKLDGRWHHPIEHAWMLKVKEVERLAEELDRRKAEALTARGAVTKIVKQIASEESQIDKINKEIERVQQEVDRAAARMDAARDKVRQASEDGAKPGVDKSEAAKWVKSAQAGLDREKKSHEVARAKLDATKRKIPLVENRIRDLGNDRYHAEEACKPTDEAVGLAQREVDNAKAAAALARQEWEKTRKK